MAPSTNLYVALAGYVGRPDQTGRIGVFRRDAVGGEWQHVLPDLEALTVFVHPVTRARAGRNGGRRVAQRGPRRDVRARGFPGQGQADLVVPRRCERIRIASTRAARR